MTAYLTNIICSENIIQSFHPHMAVLGEEFRDTAEDRAFLRRMPVTLNGLPPGDYVLVLDKPFGEKPLLGLRFMTETGACVLPAMEIDYSDVLDPKNIKNMFAAIARGSEDEIGGQFTKQLRAVLTDIMVAPPSFYAFMEAKLGFVFLMEFNNAAFADVQKLDAGRNPARHLN